MKTPLPLVVVCVACRKTYVQRASAKTGCPRCGGTSWIAGWAAERPYQAREM